MLVGVASSTPTKSVIHRRQNVQYLAKKDTQNYSAKSRTKVRGALKQGAYSSLPRWFEQAAHLCSSVYGGEDDDGDGDGATKKLYKNMPIFEQLPRTETEPAECTETG